MPLTNTKIRNARPTQKPFKLTDGNGLYLEVRPTGTKLWRYRYRIDGKENVFALGEYGPTSANAHVYSLSDARIERQKARELVKQGIHPSHYRREGKERAQAKQRDSQSNSFEKLAHEWLENKKARWSERYYKQALKYLKRDVFPYIGNKSVSEITSRDMLQIVQRVATERQTPVVARLVRVWCSGVFRQGINTLRCDTDPTEAVKDAIERPLVKHNRALAPHEIPKLLASLRGYGGHVETKCAIHLLLLTFVRYGELRQAKWVEIDIEQGTWRIPAERMKTRKPHLVPLSRQAVKLFQELHSVNGQGELVFPGNRSNKPIEGSTVLMALRYMGYNDISPHCFRSTASTLLNELGYNPDHIERQLAHKPRNQVRDAYNRAEYLAERALMMQGWADYIDGLTGKNVLAIKSA